MVMVFMGKIIFYKLSLHFYDYQKYFSGGVIWVFKLGLVIFLLLLMLSLANYFLGGLKEYLNLVNFKGLLSLLFSLMLIFSVFIPVCLAFYRFVVSIIYSFCQIDKISVSNME